jgi:hypothetical protein
MDIRERHFGRISADEIDGGNLAIDIDVVVRRLILFEQCLIETDMLKEVPALIDVFGARGLLELLNSGVVRVICDALTAGQVGQTIGLESTARRGGTLPYGSYRFITIGSPGLPNRAGYVEAALREVDKAGVSNKQTKQIRAALANQMLSYPPETGSAGIEDTESELLDRHPAIIEAIRRGVLAETGQDIGRDFSYSAELTGHEHDVRIETDIEANLKMSPEQLHKVIEHAVLAVAGLNQRIHLMESFQAITGLRSDELPLFEDKARFLARQSDADVQEDSFDRLITIGDLPRYIPGAQVDVQRLLRMRADTECIELRRWIRNLDAESDDQINQKFDSVRAAMSSLADSSGGRTLRFIVTAGLSFVPAIGVAAGPAATAADSFLLDRVLGKAGPAIFLSRRYPRLFR